MISLSAKQLRIIKLFIEHVVAPTSKHHFSTIGHGITHKGLEKRKAYLQGWHPRSHILVGACYRPNLIRRNHEPLTNARSKTREASGSCTQKAQVNTTNLKHHLINVTDQVDSKRSTTPRGDRRNCSS